MGLLGKNTGFKSKTYTLSNKRVEYGQNKWGEPFVAVLKDGKVQYRKGRY